jgi:pilus assembly protein Flp/PilA
MTATGWLTSSVAIPGNRYWPISAAQTVRPRVRYQESIAPLACALPDRLVRIHSDELEFVNPVLLQSLIFAKISELSYKSSMQYAQSAAMRLIFRFVKDETAATAIEYGLIAAGIALAIIPVITGLGSHVKTTFSTISAALK